MMTDDDDDGDDDGDDDADDDDDGEMSLKIGKLHDKK